MTETSAGAAAARQKLGQILKESRKKKRITVEQAADHIERTRPTVWKLETGAPGVRIRPRGDIAKLCELYDVDDETRAALLTLAEATKIRGWFQPHDAAQRTFPVYLDLERVATEIFGYEPELIPGLLQSESYARAIMSHSDDGLQRGNEEIDFHVTRRLRRQDLLTRKDAPDIEFFINETSLRRPIGGHTSMVAQLQHLHDVSNLPHVTLRVLPIGIGHHHGLISGQFHMLRFDDRSPVVCADSFMGILWFGQPKEIARYTAALRMLRKQSLSHRDSQKFITLITQELSRYA